jgi:hypothetical protein
MRTFLCHSRSVSYYLTARAEEAFLESLIAQAQAAHDAAAEKQLESKAEGTKRRGVTQSAACCLKRMRSSAALDS